MSNYYVQRCIPKPRSKDDGDYAHEVEGPFPSAGAAQVALVQMVRREGDYFQRQDGKTGVVHGEVLHQLADEAARTGAMKIRWDRMLWHVYKDGHGGE